ncbi:DsrE/DsrF/DrsH-like family protein [bacterium]|nr:DsrE/DsrF/DrsH-like family protein [bacterium]
MNEEILNKIAELERKVSEMPPGTKDKLSMIIFSGDLDKVLAALIISTGAVAMGMEVMLFFTFWGTTALRDPSKKAKGKNLISKMFGFMLPKGRSKIKLSKMNMGGLGTKMIKSLMKKKNVASLDELFDVAGEMGVRICVCEMSMDLMGFKREEIISYPNLVYCGVATFLKEAGESRIQLFI